MQPVAAAARRILAAQRLIASSVGGAQRCLASSAPPAAEQPAQTSGRLALGLLLEELAALSIPARELQRLAQTQASDAALTAMALIKTHGHPAADKAAAAQQRLSQLLAKLDGAALRQQAADSSPTAQLLWRVAVAAARQQARDMPPEELQQCVEHQVVAALLRLSQQQDGAPPPPTDVLSALEAHLPQLVDTSPRSALGHPAFWQLAQAAAAAASSSSLAQDLALLNYHLQTAADAAAGQQAQLQELLGLDAASLRQEVLSQLQLSPNLLLPANQQALLDAVSGSSEGRRLLGQLQLFEVLAAALGLSSVQLTLPVSSCELLRRLTSMGQAAPAMSTQLTQALQAARPTLLAALPQLPAHSLAQPSVAGLLQLCSSKAELKELGQVLTAWRAEAAAAGNLPILTSLTQAEVSALSKAQAQAVARHVMQLEAHGRLLLRQAAAGQLALQELASDDAAALAWKVHTGGPAVAEDLVGLVLMQAAGIADAHEAELGAAESAVHAMAAGFELEEVTSRLNTAAPPSAYVMAGIPQLQVSELGAPGGSSGRGSAAAATAAGPAAGSAEALVRDLAVLLTPPGEPSAESHQAAAQRLQVVAHDLPGVLSGPLLELLTSFAPGTALDAAALQRQQQQLRVFAAVVAAELPKLLPPAAGALSSDGSWAGGVQLSGASRDSAEGLRHLLGEQDTRGVLEHAAGGPDGDGHLYGWLADVHHDIDMQRYLQIEFDPALDVDVVHAPRGWQDPELFTAPADFLQGMRPALDAYLAAQGEAPLHDLEWQVYCDAALAEAEQTEAEAARARQAAGHSPFHNSRADEAFLRQRLEAGIPRDSVLYAASHKYLSAALRNRSWRFAQRRRMVDLLIAIAAHLAAHPPRSHRGSPFSALFQKDGPPLVPRLAQGSRGSGAGADGTHALPAGWGEQPAAAPTP